MGRCFAPTLFFYIVSLLTNWIFFVKIQNVSYKIWARSSVAERCPDKTEVEGPIPSGPTKDLKNSKKRKTPFARGFCF